MKEKIEQVRAKAAALGRKIRFGIRLHVIVRETTAEAWQAADRLIAHLDDDTIAKARAAFARTDSVGQHRMAALHNGKRDQLEISPNLWAGVGLVRGGAGTALVGMVQQWRHGLMSMPRWVSTALCCPGIHIWKRRTRSASYCSRIWMSRSQKYRSRNACINKVKPWRTNLFRVASRNAKEPDDGNAAK